MTGLYLPGATFRPVSYRADAGAFTSTPLGYIVHVPVSNGSLFPYFNGLTSPNRKFCTAWIAKDGSSEQYTTLDMKSWAQAAGNGDYWSFEVEGYPNEPMTDAQLATLATWHTFLGVADHVCTAPGQQGIGTHQMGGAAWGGHDCPGPVRTAQLPQIIARAQGDNMANFTEQDLKDAAAVGVLGAEVGRTGLTVAVILDRLYGAANLANARDVAQTAAIEALAKSNGADPAAIQAAVTAALDQYTLTLTKGA